MAADLTTPDKPTFYFVGMTTSQSSIMTVFPEWARHLGLNAPIAGIDCRWHDTRERYREVVSFLRDDANVIGALVTTHKIDILAAARDMFDELDTYAERLGEISCISRRDGKLIGHAKDPITSGLSLESFVPAVHWQSGAELCLLGAGGSSLALTVYCMERPESERPSRIVVTNRSETRLESMKTVHAGMNPGISVEYVHCPKPEDNDAVVNDLREGSVVANATGLGKDAPGSPLTSGAVFPRGGLVWDFNYRGDLLFLDQARAQQSERNLTIEDGWIYFIHGWTRVIAEVFHMDIPTSGPEFEALGRIAAESRRR